MNEPKNLNREEIKLIADAALTAGQTMLQSGAETDFVVEDIHKMATTLGAQGVNLMVLPQTIAMTLTSGDEFRTKMRHISSSVPNMQRVSQAHRLCRNVDKDDDPVQIISKLRTVCFTLPPYGVWLRLFAGGFACAAFCALFGAEVNAVAVAFVAALLAAAARHILDHHGFNPLFAVTIAAFTATFCAGAFEISGWITDSKTAQASAVLLLVPGVQLINSFEDMINGHFLSGMARGMRGALVSFGIVVGIVIALKALKVFG